MENQMILDSGDSQHHGTHDTVDTVSFQLLSNIYQPYLSFIGT